MLTIRPYQTGDAKKVYQLFAANTPYLRDANFWIWINRLLSEEPSIICIAEIDGEIVGHYAIIPRLLELSSKIQIKAGLGIHAFVAPDYRDKVSIFSITAVAYKMAEEKGIELIYGFPNANYRLIQEKIERWNRVSLFKALQKEIHFDSEYKQYFEWNLACSNSGEDLLCLNNLIEMQGNDFIKFKINLNYFVNRYLRHPQDVYQAWILKKNNKAVAFVVTKIFISNGVSTCHIVDFLDNGSVDWSFMLKDFENILSPKATVSIQWPRNTRFKKLLLEVGYTENSFETFFGIKLLNDNAKNFQTELLEISNWNLVIGDSDAF